MKNTFQQNKSSDIIYLFDILTCNNQQFFLSSHTDSKKFQDNEYLPYSGLYLEQLHFNDSADNYAYISGIYEDMGIDKNCDLISAKISTHILLGDKLKSTFTYTCSEYEKNDLNFIIKIVPETYKYKACATQNFSKTCRANFGDKYCKIDINNLAKTYSIHSITNRQIHFYAMNEKSTYYNGGTVLLEHFDSTKYTYKITTHMNNIISVASDITLKLFEINNVQIYPTCNKMLATCIKKFDNAINFRGEPYIPEYKILEN